MKATLEKLPPQQKCRNLILFCLQKLHCTRPFLDFFLLGMFRPPGRYLDEMSTCLLTCFGY